MKALYQRLLIVFVLIRNGNLKPILDGFSKRLYSKTNFIGLEASPFELCSTQSKINIIIRPFQVSDVNSLNEEYRHSRLVKAQIPECYVATTKENVTIYRQWLFTYESQEQVTDYFGSIFPTLAKNEAIIEGVFTHPDYRGLRIMSNAMSKILQQEHYKDLNRVIVFVEEKNISSLKGFYRIGFSPFILRQEVWCFFRRKVSFIQILDKVQNNHLAALS